MILSFEKPKKVRSTEEHNNLFSSDCGVAGTFVPNMSKKDELKWRAKHIGGEDERVEIRKTLGGAQVLIVVFKNPYHPPYPKYPETRYTDSAYHVNLGKYKEKQKEWYKRHENIKLSMNGKIDMTLNDYNELSLAIQEAFDTMMTSEERDKRQWDEKYPNGIMSEFK
jgi:hypothetical protein